MSIPKKHHFLPKCYLKQWAGKDGKVEYFYQPTETKLCNKKKNYKSTGFKKFLYSIKNSPVDQSQKAESAFFSPVDNGAAQILRYVNQKGGFQCTSDVNIWRSFLTTLLLRMPSDIEGINSFLEAELTSLSQRVSCLLQKPKYKEQQFEKVQTVIDQINKECIDKSIYIIIRLMGEVEMSDLYNNFNFKLIHTINSEHELLISDRPALYFKKNEQSPFHLAVPMGPRYLFLGSNDLTFLNTLCSNSHDKLVRCINREIISQARICVIASNDSQANYVKKHFAKSESTSLFCHMLPILKDEFSNPEWIDGLEDIIDEALAKTHQ